MDSLEERLKQQSIGQSNQELNPLSGYIPPASGPRNNYTVMIVVSASILFLIGSVVVKKAFFTPADNQTVRTVTVLPSPSLVPPTVTPTPFRIYPDIPFCPKIDIASLKDWKTYTNDELGISFRYPPDWNLSLNKKTLQLGPKTEVFKKTGGFSLEIYGFPLSPEELLIRTETESLFNNNSKVVQCQKNGILFHQYVTDGGVLDFIGSDDQAFTFQLADVNLYIIYNPIISTFNFLENKGIPVPTGAAAISREEALVRFRRSKDMKDILQTDPAAQSDIFRDDLLNNRWVIRVHDTKNNKDETVNFYYLDKSTGDIKMLDLTDLMKNFTPVLPTMPPEFFNVTPLPSSPPK